MRAMRPWRWAAALLGVVVLCALLAPSFVLWRAREAYARAQRYEVFVDATPETCLWKALRSDEARLEVKWFDDELGEELKPWLTGSARLETLPDAVKRDLSKWREPSRAALACEPSVTARVDYTAINPELISLGRMAALDVRARLEAGDAPGAAEECVRALRWTATLAGPYGSLFTTEQMAVALESPCRAALTSRAAVSEAARLLPTAEAVLGMQYWIFARAQYAEVTTARVTELERLPSALLLARKCSRGQRLFENFLAHADQPGPEREAIDARFEDVIGAPEYLGGNEDLPNLEAAMKRFDALRSVFTRLSAP